MNGSPAEIETASPRHAGRRKLFLIILVTALIASLLGAGTVLLLERRLFREYRIYLEAARVVERNFVGEYDTEELVESSIDGLVSGLGDRWSYYLAADEVPDYQANMQNRYVGIGVVVTKPEGGGMRVMEVYPDSGAAEAGLVPGDEILRAGGEDLVPLSLEDAKSFVVGEENTSVLLTIRHESGLEEEISVVRRSVFVPPVAGRMIGSVGYIQIKNFDDGASESFIQTANELLEEGATALLFDVRFNGGGYVLELTRILDYLLPEGDVFVHITSDGRRDVTTSDANCVSVPMAVLVNSDSYSAAEYFSALLQINGVPVVGEHTVGKGYSQQTLYLSDGSALVLSTKMYALPDGTSLAGVGLEPDFPVELTEEQRSLLYYDSLPEEDDLQLQTALSLLADAAAQEDSD